MNSNNRIFDALRKFADSVSDKIGGISSGEPEAQLHGPLLELFKIVGEEAGYNLLIEAESHVGDRVGIPDFAVSRERLLIGYIETKAPGVGANAPRFSQGHNKRQWERFQVLPNILYTDGNEWALFQEGERIGSILRLNGDISQEGKNAVTQEDSINLYKLLTNFLAWEIIPPKNAKELAILLAPICRILRDEVIDTIADHNSPLMRLANEWREHLFPGASNERFADAYAQTITYALLLARAEGADTTEINSAAEALEEQHTMLSRSLQVMTDPQAQREIRPALRLIQRLVNSVDTNTLSSDNNSDPWLYFYEDFLSVYDAKLRKDAGAYYTPVEVVHAQVRLVDHLLTKKLGMEMGFADGGNVTTIDPAVGTGTYLLGIIDHAMKRVEFEEGPGAIRARASLLWQNIHGFELMVSPYAVAELRLTQSLRKYGGSMPGGGPPIYLTNTLESPHVQPPAPPLFYEPIAKEHQRALQVKDRTPIRICIGNPPYDRHEAANSRNRAKTGAWVRWGDEGAEDNAPLNDYTEPVQKAGYGGHLKNIYNLYVYFWRWAFWKVFEHSLTPGSGIVTYISAASYLDGEAFLGMREHMRRICDEIWVIDLGGEGRGTRKSENIFAIQTPVAICITLRSSVTSDKWVPANVHYTRIEGTREEKLKILDQVYNLEDFNWQECSTNWQAPFRPTGNGVFYEWPQLTDLFPWQQPGVMVGRRWPISPSKEVLEKRWHLLCQSNRRKEIFNESKTGRSVEDNPTSLPPKTQKLNSISTIDTDTPPPEIILYGYRSFDRQYLIADARLIDRVSPPLWATQSSSQLYLVTLLSQPLHKGPAVTITDLIPDRDFFRGSYGGRIMPLYRDAPGNQPNILPGLLEKLNATLDISISPEDWISYVYAILANPTYTERFHEQLTDRKIHVPITTSTELFSEAVKIGKSLIWLHTYGNKLVPHNRTSGSIPRGTARCTVSISDYPDTYPETFSFEPDRQALIVGEGEVSPVLHEIWNFEVSGLKVVQSWLRYRMRKGAGRKTSSLNNIRPDIWTAEFTTDLLHLIWVLEHTLEYYHEQSELLEMVLNSDLLNDEMFPPVPEKMRKAPKFNSSISTSRQYNLRDRDEE